MKAVNFRIFLFLTFLLFVGGIAVKGQSKVCFVTTYFWDNESKSSSSRSLVGKFPLELDGDQLVKELKYSKTSTNVYVGVEQITSVSSQKTKTLRVAISFDGNAENIFDELNRAEAETVYDRNWRFLSVSKNIKIEHRVYTFTFSCEKENTDH